MRHMQVLMAGASIRALHARVALLLLLLSLGGLSGIMPRRRQAREGRSCVLQAMFRLLECCMAYAVRRPEKVACLVSVVELTLRI